ncbi:pyridoxamine 5'-phosphate oxidase family protein [Streptomyces sp. A7024]|uniref:Pyridoxamine 5'-phosphate oxidase family protein n=1 Tax=Streptomyces coryli TaxID=1128680 RepID=A0A6G4UDP3_9ACTN|nr:pyridoxamine 5'-phosphate oxidase family protein [Streptomyces coryli]NGN69467.1 pyridoxamine 5'-phosphate oxidase family protein [Streptomyces coryli]
MTAKQPRTEFDERYSSAQNQLPGAENAGATDWAEAQRQLEEAEIFQLSTVRPDGRLHITPLIAAWDASAGLLYFSTGPAEQKAKNLARDRHCALTTGGSSLTSGRDIVVEGTAEQITDPAAVEQAITRHEAKYGAHMTSPEGTFHGMGDAIRKGEVLVFAVTPHTAYAFGRENGVYSHTRYTF